MPNQTPAQYAASIANAFKSTGPKTEAGKTASSQNAVVHGLSSRFMVHAWEDADEYAELCAGFQAEFPPTSSVETELLESMIRSCWLARRAVLLQEFCFKGSLPECIDPKLPLYLRYQTTHERAFHKAYATLLKIKAEREKSQMASARQEAVDRLGFVSQKRQEASETRKQQQHEAALRVKDVTIRLQEARVTHFETLAAARNRSQAAPHSIPIAA
jgi:flagellar hook-basal body complex protein FliE